MALSTDLHYTYGGCESQEGGSADRGMKPDPNHRRYIAVLRAMTDEQRLRKALELSELSRELFMTGLRDRYPELDEAAFRRLYLERLQLAWDRQD